MTRSEINDLIRRAIAFFDLKQFHLPPFASWSPSDWSQHLPTASEIVNYRLGWDVTDFGRGRFDECGLILFTLRNGSAAKTDKEAGKPYAEKAMIVGVDQVTPMHHHWAKTEDIINRGGGQLMIRIHGVDEGDRLSQRDISYSTDGIRQTSPAGHVVVLEPGESITLTPGIYHSFWAETEPVLAGEISSINDDEADNCFHVPVGRFPIIEEDEPMRVLLVSDYEEVLSER